MGLTLRAWDAASTAQRRDAAQKIARRLPSAFEFTGLTRYALGDQSREIAEFAWDGVRFVMIPGGRVTIGFDPESWEPDDGESASYQETRDEYDGLPELRDYLESITTRIRKVEVPPLLVEADLNEFGWEPVPSEHPHVRKIVAEHRKDLAKSPRGTVVTTHSGDQIVRVKIGGDGSITAERQVCRDRDGILARFAEAGFRLLSSDEWEWVCSGAARTLFRWGDHVPCDRYPTDVNPAEAEWRRDWALSGGTLEYPPEGFESDWDLHRRPNGFGVSIASDPYHYELVQEPEILRGGDGGSMVCGGAGFLMGWLPIATSYFDAETCRCDPDEPLDMEYHFARRVFELE